MKVLCKKTFFEPRQRERIRYYFFKDKYYDIKKENENTYWILHDVYDYDIEVYKNKNIFVNFYKNTHKLIKLLRLRKGLLVYTSSNLLKLNTIVDIYTTSNI